MPEQSEASVEHPHVAVARDDERLRAVHLRCLHQVALGPDLPQSRSQRKSCHELRGLRRAEHDSAGSLRLCVHRYGDAGEAAEPLHELILGRLERGRIARLDHMAQRGPVLLEPSSHDLRVAKPELRSVFVRRRLAWLGVDGVCSRGAACVGSAGPTTLTGAAPAALGCPGSGSAAGQGPAAGRRRAGSRAAGVASRRTLRASGIRRRPAAATTASCHDHSQRDTSERCSSQFHWHAPRQRRTPVR